MKGNMKRNVSTRTMKDVGRASKTVRFDLKKAVSEDKKSVAPMNKDEYFQFAETINGRVSMLGWNAGVLAQWVSGQDLEKQFDSSLPEITFVSLLLTLASLYTYNDKSETSVWTMEAEKTNGRLAMVGISVLAAYELVKNNM
tara:strand:- start:255 stop:680 length:426 start_codon:yes stop_codon:yes gene_type:complete